MSPLTGPPPFPYPLQTENVPSEDLTAPADPVTLEWSSLPSQAEGEEPLDPSSAPQGTAPLPPTREEEAPPLAVFSDEPEEGEDSTLFTLPRSHGALVPFKKPLIPVPAKPLPSPVKSGIRLLTDSELTALPSPTWLIEGILPANSFAVLFGESTIGKSFLALDFACHIATGLSWRGHTVTKGRVIYLIAEGVYGFKSRRDSWKSYHDIPPEEDLDILYIPDPISFRDRAISVGLLIEALLPLSPSLLVVDTLARCLVGGDENTAKDMGLFVDSCEEIRKKVGCTVQAIHHPDKNNRSERGSGSLRAAADVSMEAAFTNDNTRVLTCVKQKDFSPFDPIPFELTPEGDSLVPTFPDSAHLLKPNTQKVLDVLQGASRPLSAKEWLYACALAGISERTFWRCRKELEEKNRLAVTSEGFAVVSSKSTT